MSYSTTENAVETFYEKNCYAQQYKEDLFSEGGEEEPDEYDLMVYISDNVMISLQFSPIGSEWDYRAGDFEAS